MSEQITLLAVILAWFLTNGMLFLVFSLTVTQLFGVGVAETRVGLPPRFIQFRWLGSCWKVGLLPFSTGITVLDTHNRDECPEMPSSKRCLSEVSLGRQMLLIVGNQLVLGAIAVATLSPGSLWGHLLNALPKLLSGALDPFVRGQELLAQFVESALDSPSRALGIISAKVLPWTLIPFLGSPIYAAGYRIAVRCGFVTTPTRTEVGLLSAILLWLPGFIPYVGWFVAVGWYLCTG